MGQGRSDVEATALLGGRQLRVFGRAPWPKEETAQVGLCSVVTSDRAQLNRCIPSFLS